jgi:HYR domain-containing protein/carboxypeptidase family protein
VTNATGAYSVSGLFAGSYKVAFQDCGTGLNLATSFYDDRPDLGSANSITAAAGQTVTNINARMIVGGSISGHVTSPSADHLAGVCVAAELPTTGAVVTGALTAADGSYTLTGLAPGSYKVHFLTVNCPFATAGDYAPQWYNAKVDAASADPVTVTATHNTPNIDAQMARPNTTDTTPPVVTVPSGGATINATGPDGATVTFTATAHDDVDGALTPTCDPASGALFPIGSTRVTCAATDAAGNTGTATFTVTVTRALAQIAVEITWVQASSLHPGTKESLTSKLDTAQTALAVGDTASAKDALNAALHFVDAQTGKKIPVETALQLRADITRIIAVIGD